MPWKDVKLMDEKQRFVHLAGSGHFTVTELCEEFGISRKTGHKWLTRFAQEGLKGLEDRSRAPISSSHRTDEAVERIIVSERRLHATWGPKKIHRVLTTKHGIEKPPAVSTVGEILKRHGLVTKRRRRGGVFKVERVHLTPPEHSQHVLGVDFKGWFCTGDGARFEPLTVTDLYSRYLMRSKALPQSTVRWTQKSFRALFKQEGLPEIIRVDNGSPFASMGPGGLSSNPVVLVTLG